MVYYQSNKVTQKMPDLEFMKLIKNKDSLYVLFFAEGDLYTVAIKVGKRYYFIYSTTIAGMKTKLRYLGLKPSVKLKKEIFLPKYH